MGINSRLKRMQAGYGSYKARSNDARLAQLKAKRAVAEEEAKYWDSVAKERRAIARAQGRVARGRGPGMMAGLQKWAAAQERGQRAPRRARRPRYARAPPGYGYAPPGYYGYGYAPAPRAPPVRRKRVRRQSSGSEYIPDFSDLV